MSLNNVYLKKFTLNMKAKIHTICTVLLGLFFIYKGIDKIPIELKAISQEDIIATIIEKS